MTLPTKKELQQAVEEYISKLATPLRELNQKVTKHPPNPILLGLSMKLTERIDS